MIRSHCYIRVDAGIELMTQKAAGDMSPAALFVPVFIVRR